MQTPREPTIRRSSRAQLMRVYRHYGGLTVDPEYVDASIDRGARQAPNGAKQQEALRQLAHLDMLDVLDESGNQTKSVVRLTGVITFLTVITAVATLWNVANTVCAA